MRKITLTLIIILLVSCGNDSAKEEERAFTNHFVQAATKKDPVERLEKLESLMDVGDEYERYIILGPAAKAAFSSEDYEKANFYSRKLLSIAPQYQDGWNYGNAIHDGHLVLGRIALQNGDLNKAKEHLLLAGKTPGSPQLNNFGPNMSLANELLEAGEKKAVIEYFEECKNFWETNDGRLDSWIASIKGGGKPYFGANLRY